MNNITVHSNKQTQYEFNLTSTGVVLDSGNVFVLIETQKDISMRIQCQKLKGQTWQLTVPENTLKDGSYKYTVTAIVDHYYFEAYTGKIDVLSDSSFSVEQVEFSQKSDEEDENEQPQVPQKVAASDKPNKKQKKSDTKVNEQAIQSEVEVVVEHPVEKVIEPIISKPIFNFNATKHPYNTLKDNGETDKKVRAALQRLKTSE